MNTILKVIQLEFLPRNADVALLALRLWLGLSLVCLHGWHKVSHFGEMSKQFPDPLGLGPSLSLALVAFAEAPCALLLALGLLTRFAALTGAISMSVAFVLVHKMALSGPHSGELAFIYLAGYVTLLVAGSGRFAPDPRLGAKPPARRQ